VKEEATRERKQNALLATLRNVPTGLITTAERPLIEQGILAGTIDEKDLVNLVTGRGRAPQQPTVNMANIRLTAVKNLTEELGRTPTETEVNDYVRLIVPTTAQPTRSKTLSDIYDEDEPVTKRPAAPVLPQAGGGLFTRPMFAAPTGAAPTANIDEIRALATRLAELRRGGRFGTIAEREEYERNAPERRRVQAALDEAQRRYQSR